MNNKINIIQFLPYFPPHKGGLETHAEQWGKWWVKKDFGEVFNVITDLPHPNPLLKGEGITEIVFKGKTIGYKKDGVENLIVPSFEVIPNFPVYKVWTKEYRLIIKYIKTKTSPQPSPRGEGVEQFIVISRTRFFITSLVGGLFARKNKIKWSHIEHGSDYVKLNSSFKNIVAKFYDKLIGNWIFRKADVVVGVSDACRKFIKDEFVDRNVEVIYRGLDLPKISNITELKETFKDKIIIGFVGRLFKWKNIDSLINAYYKLDDELKRRIQIVVVGEGEDFDRLNKLDIDNKIHFTGGKSFNEAIELQSGFDIHFHTSSPGGGLATTLLQAMNLGCFIVSTPYEGADEVIVDGKNGILLKDDSVDELKRGLEEGVEGINKKEEFALANKEIFENSFTWDKNIEKYYNLFR